MNQPTPTSDTKMIFWSIEQARAYNEAHPEAHIPPVAAWVELDMQNNLIDKSYILDGDKAPGLLDFIRYLMEDPENVYVC